MSRNVRPSARPQPRVERGYGKGRFTNRALTDGSELVPDSDRDRYTARFADLDVFTIEHGEVVDFDPTAGARIGEYQSVLSNGYENRL